MNRRIAVLALLAGCGIETTGGDEGRGKVARAAITVEANEVSCSSPAATAFGATGVCLCEDVSLVGSGLTVMSSEKLAVDVGVNGESSVVGDWQISGTLDTWGNVSGVGQLEVGNDLVVGGDLSTVGNLKVGGAVRAKGKVTAVGSSGADRAPYLRETPPCGCDPAQLLDVKAAVEAVRDQNDNASIGLQSRVKSVGELELELSGGRYFIDGLTSVGGLKLHVTKPSALYIAGDLKTVGTDTFDVDENASLDLYVAGSIENVGAWSVGEGTLAGVVRLFIGGDGSSIDVVGEKDFVGAIYAPTSDLKLVGDMNLRGALFAKSLSGTGHLLLDHAKNAAPAAGTCR
ncbi:MAG: hypothetical protein JNK82_20860 [Myxococcaceae bacterium]|nr:hypothetical protein [Myxococcaceae bacterium]